MAERSIAGRPIAGAVGLPQSLPERAWPSHRYRGAGTADASQTASEAVLGDTSRQDTDRRPFATGLPANRVRWRLTSDGATGAMNWMPSFGKA